MALTDIQFQAGDGQDFLLELGAGGLNAPQDIVGEADGSQYPASELPQPGRIFVISE
jgi:hypothetical protein